MATMEYTREARCLDCKYYVPAPKPFAKSMCGLTESLPIERALFARIGNLNTISYGKKL